jgi:hypothetical protein
MGSKRSSEQVIKLLDCRGEKELARTLRRRWIELNVHNADSFSDELVAAVQFHAPLKEYESLRSSADDPNTLLSIFQELYTRENTDTVDIDWVLEIEDQSSVDGGLSRGATRWSEQRSFAAARNSFIYPRERFAAQANG